MKKIKTLFVIALFLLFSFICVFNTGPSKDDLPVAIKKISLQDITTLTRRINKSSKDWCVSKEFQDDDIDLGIVQCKDGNIIKFAFVSHHVSQDRNSYAYFEKTGYSRSIQGIFCCEVEFGFSGQPDDIKQFDILLDSCEKK